MIQFSKKVKKTAIGKALYFVIDQSETKESEIEMTAEERTVRKFETNKHDQ